MFEKTIEILIGYVLTCVISYPIRYFLLGEKDGFMVWLERFYTFSNYSWYVEMYIGLILISPVLNLALDSMQTPRQIWLLTGSVVLATTLPTITPLDLLPDWWIGFYPLGY